MKLLSVSVGSQPERRLYGLHQPSSDRAQGRDIPALCARTAGPDGKNALPLYILSRDYDPKTGRFLLFVGGEAERPGLESEVLPAGLYARLAVRPLLGVFWGAAIGRAKRWFYTQWLTSSSYEAEGFEYELHTEASQGRHASVELRFAVRRRA